MLRSLQPGERAPDFTLTAANRDGVVSLAEYRAKPAELLSAARALADAS